MAITTLDGAVAGMQPPYFWAKTSSATGVAGRPQSLWALAGSPGAGTFNSTLNGGTYSSSSTIPAGAFPHYDPTSGNSYLARLSCADTVQGGMLLLCDRIWDNQLAVSNTSLQSITMPTLPNRDNAGTNNGDGYLAAIEISAATSATAAALTSYTYTNQAGNSSSGVFLDAPTAVAAAIGQFYRLSLAAGDTGIRTITGVTFSTAWTSGTINMVLYRTLAAFEIPGANIGNTGDIVTLGLPQLWNGVCPWVVRIPSGAAVVNSMGTYCETQG